MKENRHPERSSNIRVCQLLPVGKIWLSTHFCQRILLECSHTHLFMNCLRLLSCSKGGVEVSCRNCMVWKSNIATLGSIRCLSRNSPGERHVPPLASLATPDTQSPGFSPLSGCPAWLLSPIQALKFSKAPSSALLSHFTSSQSSLVYLKGLSNHTNLSLGPPYNLSTQTREFWEITFLDKTLK